MEEPVMNSFFHPKGVAMVGVSKDPAKLGYMLARNIAKSGYSGAIHYVNPKGGVLFGHTIYSTIREVPDPADLVVILVPAALVPATLAEAGGRGIKAAIVATGAFRETGAEGARLEEESLEVAQKYGMRIMGPNCIGLLDTHVPIDVTFLQPPGPPAGDIAFFSHSGAICAVIIDWISREGIGLSRMVSLGNQVDINETDILELTKDDPHTKVITLYMEGVSDGRRFVKVASEVSRRKPIVALKMGRYSAGKKAASSHTGALAGTDSAFDAGFRKAGVLRAHTTEQLLQWAKALAWCPLPKGNRIAVLTNAGGPGVTAADAIEENGLQMAELSPDSKAQLKKFLSPAASVNNPVDMIASAHPDHYSQSLQILLVDPQVDGVIVILPPPPNFSAGWVAKLLIPIIQSTTKPVIMVLMGHRLIQEGVEFLRAAEIVEFNFAETAASAMGALWRRAQYLAQPELPKEVLWDNPALRTWLQNQPDGWLSMDAVHHLLEQSGVRSLQLVSAATAEDAVQAADKIGYPVALKIDSPDILHKSDIGGVLLGLKNADEVRQGFAAVMARAVEHKPDAHVLGVQVQEMLPAGQDVIAGMVQDVQFGPMMMFGSGGTEVEGLKDVAFELASLTPEAAEHMLASTWAGKKLDGFRNIPPADRQAAVAALVRLSQVCLALPEIQELEINPLRVLAPGQGAVALDVRVRKQNLK